MLEVAPPTGAMRCPSCDTELGPNLLACPNCQRLVHADELKRLAEEAERLGRQGDPTAALSAWRTALELLPPNSRQYEAIVARVEALSREVDTGPQPAAGEHKGWTGGAGGAAGLGTLGLMLWKFKFLAFAVLTKGKFLLLGLTKASTLFSMLLSLGVYWAAFGWRFGLGLVLSIYIHEMGHVAALKRYGIKFGAPMFIPGVGALIRVRQTMPDPRQDARVGLAGPIWGLGAALAAYGVFLATSWPIWAAVAQLGAVINLFNLIPIWQLDGSRGLRSMTRHQRWLSTVTIAVMWSVTAQPLLILLLAAAAFKSLGGKPAARPDWTATFQYMFLIVVLSAMTLIPVSLAH